MDTLRHFLDVMKAHWNTLALLATWTGIGIIYLRRRSQWQRKHFLAQVNFSVNYLRDNTLVMRTLLEEPATRVWLNEYGVRMVLAAAHKATIEDPFIVLKDPRDMDFANRAVLNLLSERFADSFLAAALGVSVRTGTFWFVISCEKYEEIRTLKLRVLIVEEETFKQLFGPDNRAAKLQVDSAIYRARLNTLRKMYDLYVREQGAERHVLGQVELGVPE